MIIQWLEKQLKHMQADERTFKLAEMMLVEVSSKLDGKINIKGSSDVSDSGNIDVSKSTDGKGLDIKLVKI